MRASSSPLGSVQSFLMECLCATEKSQLVLSYTQALNLLLKLCLFSLSLFFSTQMMNLCLEVYNFGLLLFSPRADFVLANGH